LLITLPAALTFIAGVIMMLPIMRRRAAERGMSGDIIVPGIIAMIGGGVVFGWNLHLKCSFIELRFL